MEDDTPKRQFFNISTRQGKRNLRELFVLLHPNSVKNENSIFPIRKWIKKEIEGIAKKYVEDIPKEQAYEYVLSYLIDAGYIENYEWIDAFENTKIGDDVNDKVNLKYYIQDYDRSIPLIEDYREDILDPIINVLQSIVNEPIAVSIIFIGINTQTQSEYKKSTPLRHIDMETILELLNKTIDGMIGLPSSQKIKLTGFKIQKLNTDLTAGYSKKFNVKSINSYDILGLPNEKNNCLFDCIEYFKNDKVKISTIKEIRKDVKLEGKINMSNALMIGKKYFELQLSFYIIDDNQIKPITEETEYKILIEDEHYSVLINNKKDDEIVAYDIESFVNDNGNHTAYIIGFSYGNEYETLEGDDCLDKFYHLMGTEKFKKYKYLLGYNSSNFDFHLLLSKALKYEKIDDKKEIIISNGSILSYEYQGKKIVDLNKFISGSLKKNLNEFGCIISKGEINHNLSCRWEDTKIKRRIQVKEYLKKDVLGLMELYKKMNNDVYEEFNVNICDFITGSQMWDTISKRFYPDEAKKSLNNTIERTTELRQALYGGRTEVYKRYFKSKHLKDAVKGNVKYDEIDDYLICLDKVSLYPSVMRNFEFPIGRSKKTTFYMKDYLGIYHIKYETNKDLLYAILPKKIDKMLIWDLKDGEGWFSSIDIQNAINFGYKIKVIQGYYWNEKSPIFRDYIDTMIRKKNNSEKGSSKYLMYKTAMNCIYGKQLQKDIFAKSIITDSKNKILLLMKTNDCYISELGNKLLLEYEPFYTETLISKRPIEVGIFILSYSRMIMLDEFKKYDTIEKMAYYTDTDSIYVESKYMDKSVIGKELGMMNNDFGTGKILEATFISPKLYNICYITDDNKIHYECVGKGVKNDLLNYSDYKKLLSGETLTFKKEFQMKKSGIKKGLIIKHLKDVEKRIKMNNDKRIFEGNVSFPFKD